MGRDARLNAALTNTERQDRRLERVARIFRDVEHLHAGLTGMSKAEWTRCLEVMTPHLTFNYSPANDRWLRRRLEEDNQFAARQAEIALAMKREKGQLPDVEHHELARFEDEGGPPIDG